MKQMFGARACVAAFYIEYEDIRGVCPGKTPLSRIGALASSLEISETGA